MRKFDLYRKLPQDLIEPSTSGAFISFSSLLLMALLFLAEFREYMSPQVETQMFINQSKEDSLRVNMDIFFPRMPCDFISVDQQDVIGTHSINLKGDLQKRRFLDGAMIESFSANKEPDVDRAKEAFEKGEGCQLVGYILVQKVPGNFHISSHPYGGPLNLILPFVGMQTIDLSHEINHLSFGNQGDLQEIRKKFKQGLLNPLDGVKRIKNKELKNLGVQHQYYISIVPTIYQDIKSNSYFVNQFTANTNEAQTNQMPAVFFRYEMSPVTVKFTQYYETLWHFLVQICAILGGVFTIAGIVDSIIYACSKPKVELAK